MFKPVDEELSVTVVIFINTQKYAGNFKEKYIFERKTQIEILKGIYRKYFFRVHLIL